MLESAATRVHQEIIGAIFCVIFSNTPTYLLDVTVIDTDRDLRRLKCDPVFNNALWE